MKLPMLVIASFRPSCQTDMDDIEKFLNRYNPEDLVAKTGIARKLERLQTSLWPQWCRMDVAWCNHNPTDGNVGTDPTQCVELQLRWQFCVHTSTCPEIYF